MRDSHPEVQPSDHVDHTNVMRRLKSFVDGIVQFLTESTSSHRLQCNGALCNFNGHHKDLYSYKILTVDVNCGLFEDNYQSQVAEERANSSFTATVEEIRAMRQSSASAGLIVVIVVVLLAVVVIALDLTCYFVNKRGIIMTLRQRFRPASTTRGTTEKALEDGEKYVKNFA
jgi:hypothetical protein